MLQKKSKEQYQVLAQKSGAVHLSTLSTKWVRDANKVAGFLGGQIINYLSFSVGDFVAKALDRYDGVENGVWTIFEQLIQNNIKNIYNNGEINMDKKFIAVLIIVMVAMVLDDIFSYLGLVWYIQLLPFAIVILGYVIILFKSKSDKKQLIFQRDVH